MGVVVAVAGTSQLFAPWHLALAEAFGFTPSRQPDAALELLFGILGGSICGKWLATAAVVHFGGPWAKPALWFALLSWFGIDSAVSALHGAWFNIWMINLAPLILVGGLIFRWTPPEKESAEVRRRGDTLLIATLALLSLSGLVFAFGTSSPLMAPWLERWHALIADDASADRLLAFLGGPIGGTVFAHFGLLAWAAWARPSASWLPLAVAGSVGAWFAIDATCSLLVGAAFNVLLIDLPCLVAVLAALGLRAVMNRRS